jgi:hypothetical protein
MLERWPVMLLKAAFFPIYLGLLLVEEISGEGRWYRRQKDLMVSGRPPLSDAGFLEAEGVPESDAPWWLAVRGATGESCGIPGEAVYPGDRLADLWRMHPIGPDLMDIVFRLERSLGLRIPRRVSDRILRQARGGGMEEFRQFARLVAEELRELPENRPV